MQNEVSGPIALQHFDGAVDASYAKLSLKGLLFFFKHHVVIRLVSHGSSSQNVF